MLLYGTCLTKTLSAIWALVGFFSSVAPMMDLQTAQVGKAFPTVCALVRHHPVLPQSVQLEAIDLRVTLSTVCAFMRLPTLTGLTMLFQIDRQPKAFSTM